MIDIEKLRRLHLGPSLTGTARKDNWPIGDASLLSAGTLRALLDELEALRAANQWLPIEGAPRGYVDLIIYEPDTGRNNDVGEGYFEDADGVGDGRWIWSADSSAALPTHYRPLPPPPQD